MTKLQFCIILFSFVRYFRQSLEPGIKLKDLYYFREECSNKGGTNGGSCASGFGVCCTCKLNITKLLWIHFSFINAFFN